MLCRHFMKNKMTTPPEPHPWEIMTATGEIYIPLRLRILLRLKYHICRWGGVSDEVEVLTREEKKARRKATLVFIAIVLFCLGVSLLGAYMHHWQDVGGTP
jgi:hypothetical protein